MKQIQANVDDYARALHDVRANTSAVAMAAATTALQAMIAAVGPNAPIRLSAITSAHAALMHDDPLESSAAGELRTVQNWIGGSDFSPARRALYPAAGNGAGLYGRPRHLRRSQRHAGTVAGRDRACAVRVDPPIHRRQRPHRARPHQRDLAAPGRNHSRSGASGLGIGRAAREYFDVLGSYRSGDLAPLVGTFVRSTRIAAAESRVTAQRLHEIPSQWRELTGPVRRGSAAAKILALLPRHPFRLLTMPSHSSMRRAAACSTPSVGFAMPACSAH